MKTASLKEWTYEEFMSLPEGGSFRTEMIDGELCMTPSPSPRHQKISLRMSIIIGTYLDRSPIGEVFAAPCDVVFSKDPPQVVEPDLVFVSKEHLSIITEKNIQGVPDLTVEILSPSTESSDRRVKHSLYERFGVPDTERVRRAFVILAESSHAVMARAHRDPSRPDRSLIDEYRAMSRGYLSSVIDAEAAAG